MSRIIGVDVGGTFTDVVVFDGRWIEGRKVPTSPDQSQGVIAAVSGDPDDLFLHGTTAATNALLEGRGARVGLLTDPGYEDLIEIARQDRPSLYDSLIDRPAPLVPRELRTSSAEKLGDCEIVAVVLVDSYDDPEKEEAAARAVSQRTVLSSRVSPEFREYERTATTVLSAYLTPSVASYLTTLDRGLPMETRLVMTSSGGLLPFSSGPAVAGRLVLSGPAGGAVAAAALGRHHGFGSVLSFDMGGTSTDVSRITGGSVTVGHGHEVGGRVNRVPSVPINTIGAGGGSVGWRDPGGALRVGPRSAGSVPGPAAYGRGGWEPTVTDANLVAGHIPAELEMGGTVTLSLEAAREAVQRLGETLGLSAGATAEGMLEVVDSHMEHALRSVSVEEGADPREAVLVAFGGAGGLHATRLARRLGMATVLVPPQSGVFSALGLLLAAPRADVARTVMLSEGDSALPAALEQMRTSAAKRFESIFGRSAVGVEVLADVRYQGQSHELEVTASPVWSDTRDRFEDAHQTRNGFRRPSEPIEIVNVRAVAGGEAPFTWDLLPPAPGDVEPVGGDGVWWRESLPVGHVVDGPAVVVEDNSATLLEGGDRLEVLEDGTMKVTW